MSKRVQENASKKSLGTEEREVEKSPLLKTSSNANL